MTTQEERISRLEGAYEHLATKADVEEFKVMIADLRTDMADQRAMIADIKADLTWRVAGLQLAK